MTLLLIISIAKVEIWGWRGKHGKRGKAGILGKLGNSGNFGIGGLISVWKILAERRWYENGDEGGMKRVTNAVR